jgi:hypothetical protein
MAGAANSFGLGAVPCVSIDSLRRSLDRCGRPPVAAQGGDAQVLNRTSRLISPQTRLPRKLYWGQVP